MIAKLFEEFPFSKLSCLHFYHVISHSNLFSPLGYFITSTENDCCFIKIKTKYIVCTRHEHVDCLKFKEMSNNFVSGDACLTLFGGSHIRLLPCTNDIKQQVEWDGRKIMLSKLNKYLEMADDGYLRAFQNGKPNLFKQDIVGILITGKTQS